MSKRKEGAGSEPCVTYIVTAIRRVPSEKIEHAFESMEEAIEDQQLLLNEGASKVSIKLKIVK